ncbi:hypothetical protein mRhiFer1_009159 [Rhinolophus ferrumequinum]|uniref:Translationally-controlled tumor protein n=1 Tax=Rhinolophus ferrumequinum TaxID=59479 RepID=A0A7J7SJB3_RHIFE|nr:hypothetical protein mRhiFer1_009159 [Rhinolophus ferrumequinum]
MYRKQCSHSFDIFMNHHEQETSFTKEACKKYIKDYVKSLKAKPEEQKPERVKAFMTWAEEKIKYILAKFQNDQFFVDENINPDGMVALLDFAPIVSIYWDLISHDEVFSDIYKMWEIADGLCRDGEEDGQ